MLHIQTRALYPVTGGIMALGANMESLGDTAWVWGGGVGGGAGGHSLGVKGWFCKRSREEDGYIQRVWIHP